MTLVVGDGISKARIGIQEEIIFFLGADLIFTNPIAYHEKTESRTGLSNWLLQLAWL
jgi:hypothetical protein